MTQLKATRIRLYPTPAQEAAFLRIAGCCRLVYNLGLEQRRDFWRQHRATTGHSISWIGQKREITDLKAVAPFLAEVPVHCLQMALKDLDAAYGRFFDGAAGYPRPRKKGEND
ncbi:helix-turn-helix domain-containing protein, partial [Defluviimonas salinarum]